MMQDMRNTQSLTHAQQLVSLRNDRPLDELLRELYIERRLTMEEIARSLDISRMTVAMWLREFGIDRAARKAAVA